jgi:hypothetical protein
MLLTAQANYPAIVNYQIPYLIKLLRWKLSGVHQVSEIIKVDGFDQFNFLADINSVFSSRPRGIPVDRTMSIQMPVKFHIDRPWQIPTSQWTLEQAMSARVKNIIDTKQRINLFWSGGIDSTAMVAAFLKNISDYSQIRILYSPYSLYEHPGYLENFLSNIANLELVDISGDVYLNKEFDGIFFTGDGGDELHASVDESFINTYGVEALNQNWRDFFYNVNSNDKFIEFCQEYFALSNRPIETVLEARWWFYTICKNRFQLSNRYDLFSNYKNFKISSLSGFYDCAEYENFIYWNINNCITGNSYSSWKQILKNYCAEFDGYTEWCRTKQKVSSTQVNKYHAKKTILQNARSICLLSDFTYVTTPNLPLFSEVEFTKYYGTTLDYLFNEPN